MCSSIVGTPPGPGTATLPAAADIMGGCCIVSLGTIRKINKIKTRPSLSSCRRLDLSLREDFLALRTSFSDAYASEWGDEPGVSSRTDRPFQSNSISSAKAYGNDRETTFAGCVRSVFRGGQSRDEG